MVAALTEPGHVGEVYEVTGPRLMTFADIAADLSRATGREIKYIDIPHDDFLAAMAESKAPKDVIWLLDYLFATVLDGRNAHLTDGIQRALGRPPKDFADYASVAAKTAIWKGASNEEHWNQNPTFNLRPDFAGSEPGSCFCRMDSTSQMELYWEMNPVCCPKFGRAGGCY